MSMVELLTDIELLTITPESKARVVIDERTGIIVMGSDVRINSVAIAQGNLVISVSETPQVSQPNAFAQGGQTEVVPRSDITVEETGTKRLAVLPQTVTLQALVDGLNALEISPRDMISILQALKAAGAMQAELVVM